MHLVVRETRDLDEAVQPQDLGLAPADVIFLSFSDADLASVATALLTVPEAQRPTMRSANIGRLIHPMSVDLFAEQTLPGTKAVVVRLLGGLDYWRYGGEQLSKVCRAHKIALAIVPGDGRPDPRLAALSTVSHADLQAIERLLDGGSSYNLRAALTGILARAKGGLDILAEPVAVDGFGVFRAPKLDAGTLGHAAIVVYRSHVLADDVAPFIDLADELEARGLSAYVLYVPSLKAPDAANWLTASLQSLKPNVVINATAFAARDGADTSPLDAADCPVLQVATVGSSETLWKESQRGLSASDLAMHVVLPELDGRIFAGAISFKERDATTENTGTDVLRQVSYRHGITHLSDLAASWARLKTKEKSQRVVALVLSTYPGRPDQIAHAVGLDALESSIEIFKRLHGAGYTLDNAPEDRQCLVERLDIAKAVRWSVANYRAAFDRLPEVFRNQVTAAWGAPENDTSAVEGAFAFQIAQVGNIVAALQPERGTTLDRKAEYHSPATPPRHSYVAFYLWLRHVAKIDALIHLGAHGTLEWLPGKAVALSDACAPSVLIGPTPMLYPFIVNDPGEAAQTKRRVSAVTLGHLPPPIVQTELSVELLELEQLVDEFSSAEGLDPRRRKVLSTKIVDAARRAGLSDSCGLTAEMAEVDAIARIDAFLCDIKELSIRDGLHVLNSVELDSIITALDGRFIAPGPSGAPSRGRSDVLPTGRNLFTVDPRSIPTQTAWTNGKRSAKAILDRYVSDHGDWPRAIVLDLWGSATLRTGGEELATALALLGVRPVWDTRSYRVTGIETSPIAELGRPRVDVTLRISGLFRDMFPAQLALFENAVDLVARLKETKDDNPLAGMRSSDQRPVDRIFGPADGTFGAGVMAHIDQHDWKTAGDLGQSYIQASSQAYRGGNSYAAEERFSDQIRHADAFLHIQDHNEIDVLTGGDFAAHEGGFAAAAASVGNASVSLYHGNTGAPEKPVVRTLKEECARIVHGRAASPRWISGQMRHGFRGAAEMAATVDAAFAFAATAKAVDDGGFERLYEAYLGDPVIAAFVDRENPAALAAMRSRFEEAIERGLWQPRRNDVFSTNTRDATTSQREAAE